MINKNQISSLYINTDGYIMCGEPDRSTSMIDGVAHKNDAEFIGSFVFDRVGDDFIFINDLGTMCHGYTAQCNEEYKYKSQKNGK